MADIYRFTLLRRPSGHPTMVESFTGDEQVLREAENLEPWDPLRIPHVEFLTVLDRLTDAPSASTAGDLLGCLDDVQLAPPRARLEQLREVVRRGDQLQNLRRGLGAALALALDSRPSPRPATSFLVRSTISLRTIDEWARGSRAKADWREGLARPLRRPAAAAPSVSGSTSSPAGGRVEVTTARRLGPPAWASVSGVAALAPYRPVRPGGPSAPRAPRRPSRIEPVGSQDLIVVRTRHLGYRLTELSRIENIAPGELRDRRHRVETEASDFSLLEVEHEEENIETLATSTKDELRAEIQTQQSRELLLSGKLRASYRGPVEVEVETSAEYNQRSGMQTSTASVHSVEVTEEASSRVRDRVLQRNERRFRRMITESNRHRFENPDNVGHTAHYYWLERVERAALYNYGRRMLYEFIIPEPAAGLRALSARAVPAPTSVAPPPTDYFDSLLELPLAAIESEFESGEITKRFTITVGPKPGPMWLEETCTKEAEGSGDDQWSVATASLTVPDGYVGDRLVVSVQTFEENQNVVPHLTAAIDGLAVKLDGDTSQADDSSLSHGWMPDSPPQWTQVTATNGLPPVMFARSRPLADSEALPPGTHKAAVLMHNFNAYAVVVAMSVRPGDELIAEYRRSLLSAVVDDYRAQYENYTAQALSVPPSEGPLERLSDAQSAELRQIERDEVKRAVLAVIRNEDPTGSSATSATVDEIQFLEQAFERNHMNFTLYGYHWSDPQSWGDQVFGLRGGDRPFREFLKSGSARVQVPVRPGYAGFVDDYMMSLEVYSGGPRPDIGSPGYLSFIEEQREALGSPTESMPVSETSESGAQRPIMWDVSTPTDLVLLKTWPDGGTPPLERMIPPSTAALTVQVGATVPDPLSGWNPGTGAVPEDPSTP